MKGIGKSIKEAGTKPIAGYSQPKQCISIDNTEYEDVEDLSLNDTVFISGTGRVIEVSKIEYQEKGSKRKARARVEMSALSIKPKTRKNELSRERDKILNIKD